MKPPLLCHRLPLLAAALLPSATNAQVPASSPAPSKPIIDQYHLKESSAAIQHAVDTGDTGTLLLVMQKHVLRRECLHTANALPRPKKKELLLLMLADEQVLKPAPMPNYATRAGMIEAGLHRYVELMCYDLLGGQPPEFHQQLTRAELDALAAKLRAAP